MKQLHTTLQYALLLATALLGRVPAGQAQTAAFTPGSFVVVGPDYSGSTLSDTAPTVVLL